MPVTGVSVTRPTTVLPVTATAATAARPPFEPAPAAAVSAASTAIAAPVTAPVRPSAAPAAIPAAASKRPLKSRAGIAAADARGLPRKFFARFLRTSGSSARARFAGKQNHILDERSEFAFSVRLLAAFG